MTLKKIGPTDLEWIAVTCSPEVTTVEFLETRDEAVDAAQINLMPSVSTYVARIERHGEHRVRGSAAHLAVHVQITPERRAALRARYPHAVGRAAIQRILSQLLEKALDAVGSPDTTDSEVTQVMAPPTRGGR